ncbi:hypothetical protein T4D_6665 [Trichinella pseudospiralis]|uniref:Uncharacterized protein n=1 Tax=Trichinella pseudospiralis TaxID=6337 RepID=A0A0V1FA88_TRIPS|nr:hypothetical protein T4D_6665 [Trichinella pseudospiralis]
MNNSVARFSIYYAVSASTRQLSPLGIRLSTAVTSMFMVMFVRYCYAKQLIKAIQVQSENLEVVNCPQLQLSAKTSSVK